MQISSRGRSGRHTYGGSGAQDLSHYNAFVLPEPNVLFTAAEKTAIMHFVQNGGGLFTFWTYVTTRESGTGVWDTLVAKVNGAAVATVSNASPHGSWFETSVNLSSHAGQTITLSLVETNDPTLPTGFFVDDVSVLA